MKKAEIKTEKGTMVAELYEDATPATVENFTKLAKDGFYNGLRFHRVIPGFVAQGGCPYSKDPDDKRAGTGGPGYTIKCETDADKQYHELGVLSMAHAGRDTGGSQFFIVHDRQNTKHLDGQHTCFGKIVEGEEHIEKIKAGDLIEQISIIES